MPVNQHRNGYLPGGQDGSRASHELQPLNDGGKPPDKHRQDVHLTVNPLAEGAKGGEVANGPEALVLGGSRRAAPLVWIACAVGCLLAASLAALAVTLLVTHDPGTEAGKVLRRGRYSGGEGTLAGP